MMDNNINVTQRKQKKQLNDTFVSDTEFDFDISSQSLPVSCEDIASLKDELNKMKLELQVAHAEIDNLNIENGVLKDKLQTCEKKLNMYKLVGIHESHSINKDSACPIKFYSPQYQLKSRRINKESTQLGVTPRRKLVTSMVNELPAPKRTVPTTSIAKFTNCNMAVGDTTKIRKIDVSKQKRIVIIADQQGKYICKRLQSQLGREFRVQSTFKPGAKFSEVLKSDQNDISKLNKDDIVVVLGGVNDDNPFDIQCSLATWLSKIDARVLVSEVPYNRHLREVKLNGLLKYVCGKYGHCSFIGMDYDRYNPRTQNAVAYICKHLLKEILALDYRCKFKKFQTRCHLEPILVDKSSQTETIENDIICVPALPPILCDSNKDCAKVLRGDKIDLSNDTTKYVSSQQSNSLFRI